MKNTVLEPEHRGFESSLCKGLILSPGSDTELSGFLFMMRKKMVDGIENTQQ
jgi:hypothetical protein